MSIKLLTEHHLEFLSLKGCKGSPDSTQVKIPHCWKSHAVAEIINYFECTIANIFECRPLVKSVYQKNDFLISQLKHMLWVLKRTVLMRRFF